MLRRSLTGAALAFVTATASADALTTGQVRAEARDELQALTFDLIAFQSGETVDEIREEFRVEGSVYDCRRTSRRRGSCVAEVVDEDTGAGCNVYVIVRESSKIRGRISRSTHDQECWD